MKIVFVTFLTFLALLFCVGVTPQVAVAQSSTLVFGGNAFGTDAYVGTSGPFRKNRLRDSGRLLHHGRRERYQQRCIGERPSYFYNGGDQHSRHDQRHHVTNDFPSATGQCAVGTYYRG